MISSVIYTDSRLKPTTISRAAVLCDMQGTSCMQTSKPLYMLKLTVNRFQVHSGPPDHWCIADVKSDNGSTYPYYSFGSHSQGAPVTLHSWHIRARAFLHLASTCCFQPRLASGITPRYLTWLFTASVLLKNLIVFNVSGLCHLVKRTSQSC